MFNAIVFFKTNVFLVCYSVISPSTYTNITNKWIPEIRHHCPDTPIVLCGKLIFMIFGWPKKELFCFFFLK